MNESPFRTFIDLISFDRALNVLETSLLMVEKERKAIKDKEQATQDDVAASRNNLNNAQKAVDALELEMKTLDGKEEEKKHRIENVTNHKEYQSVKMEIDRIKEKQHNLEKELLEAWAALEVANKTYALKKESLALTIAQLSTDVQDKEKQRDELRARIDEQLLIRLEKEKNVPAEWLEKYAAMRSRVPDPVVPVVNGHCSACFYKVSEQDLLGLARNKLLQCKDCYRFLYIESPQNKTTPSSTP